MNPMAAAMRERTWRLLETPAMTGLENMAVDELLFSQVQSDKDPPTVRLYGWEPPCISLGYAQSAHDLDLAQIQALDWHWTRRPTGGRAILHTDELTYSICGPVNHPLFRGSILESYQRISAGIERALAHLGLQVEIQEMEPASSVSIENPICFEVPAAYEITVSTRKLIGSAQHRGRTGVLQHGTLPLSGDVGRIVDGLAFDSITDREAARTRIRRRAITVEQALNRSVSWEEAADAFIHGFETEFEIDLLPFTIPSDWDPILQDIKHTRYRNQDWLKRT
jgi:lipoate-protein ligase A